MIDAAFSAGPYDARGVHHKGAGLSRAPAMFRLSTFGRCALVQGGPCVHIHQTDHLTRGTMTLLVYHLII